MDDSTARLMSALAIVFFTSLAAIAGHHALSGAMAPLVTALH